MAGTVPIRAPFTLSSESCGDHEHRFLHVGAVASGVSDGAGAAGGAPGVGEGAADGVPAVGVVAGIGIRVRFPPAARVLAERLSQQCANTGTVSRASTPYSRA